MIPSVSLVIPTWNAGPEFPENLDGMLSQRLDGPLEVIAIDSGSSDQTLTTLRSRDVRIIEIPKAEFNHGETRNLGLRESSGELVAFSVQDARPADDRWLCSLVECFDDPRVAGVYSAQQARDDASPFIRDRLSSWAAAGRERRVQEVGSVEEFDRLEPLQKLARVAFDNVSSCVRRKVALEIPFRWRRFGEDLDWAHRVILAGYRIVFEPRSLVVHSHNRSIWYEFKRVFFDHENLHRLFGVHTVRTWRDMWLCSVAGARHLWRVVDHDERLTGSGRLMWKARAWPFAFGQNLGQYLGARVHLAAAENGALKSRVVSWLSRGV